MNETKELKFTFHYFDLTVGTPSATWDRPMVLVQCNDCNGFPEFQFPHYFPKYNLKRINWGETLEYGDCRNRTRIATIEEVEELLFNNEDWKRHPDRISFLKFVYPHFEKNYKIEKYNKIIKEELGL